MGEVAVSYVGHERTNEPTDEYIGKIMMAHVHTVYGYECGECICTVAIYGFWIPKPNGSGECKGDCCLAGRERVASGRRGEIYNIGKYLKRSGALYYVFNNEVGKYICACRRYSEEFAEYYFWFAFRKE